MIETVDADAYKYRFLARLIIQSETPFSIGSGEKNAYVDNMVVKDANGLPYIPGTVIAGILRHTIEQKNGKDYMKDIFGFQEKDKSKDGQGSEIIFSSAQIIDKNGKAVEGLIDDEKNSYLKHFDNLPIRQHVKINDKGTAESKGKFDEEIVYKGVRFCFEIEMLSKDGKNNSLFEEIISELSYDTIRIGGGTRKGFGDFSIIESKIKILNLSQPEDLKAYISKTMSLNDSFWDNEEKETITLEKDKDWITYELELKPDDFFLFGSGFGDDDADITPVSETYFDWSSGKPEPMENSILIPGSSIKGALSHRTAFHYNKIKKCFAENFKNDKEKITGENNEAVRVLFGYTSQDEKEQKRGNVLISDIIQKENGEKSHILNHVAIDRFTGGAMDGALFSEKVTYGKGRNYSLKFKVKRSVFDKEPEIITAFENALNDIVTGQLPLGGGVNRGHGVFMGIIKKDGVEMRGIENV